MRINFLKKSVVVFFLSNFDKSEYILLNYCCHFYMSFHSWLFLYTGYRVDLVGT